MAGISVDKKREMELMFKGFCLEVMRLPPEERSRRVREFVAMNRSFIALEHELRTNDALMEERVRELKRELLVIWGVRSMM